MQILSEYFTDQLIFETIASYLKISDILKLAQCNRLLSKIIQQKCKRILKQHNLTLIPSKTAVHQMRFYFDRCLTIFHKNQTSDNLKKQQLQEGKQQKGMKQQKQKIQKQSKSKLSPQQKAISGYYSQRLTIQYPFKYNTIIYFQVGVQYTVCLTIDHQAYVFKTNSLININHHNKKHLNYQKRLNVVQIKCKSQNITYLKQNGQLYQIIGDKNSEKLYQRQQELQWAQNIPVDKIQASFNYTIFKPKKNNICYQEFMKYVFKYQIDLDKVVNKIDNKHQQNQLFQSQKNIDSPNKTILILLNNISLKYFLIDFQKEYKIIQICVGNRQAYFLTQKYECFVCYFQQEPNHHNQNNHPDNINPNYNKILKAKPFVHFLDKTIIKLASGYNFFLALQRKIHDVSKWTVEQVCKWVRQIGFGQFAKIFTVQKVDGNKLLTIDKNYMYSALGITKPNMQQKFIMLLSQVIQNKNKQDTLYGWGKNQNGQLCSRNANFIKQPQKIKLPNCFKQSQYIDSIFCGWFQTFIRTQKGRVYKTLNNQKKKRYKQSIKQSENMTVQSNLNQKKLNNINKNFRQNKNRIVDFQEGYDSENQYQNKKHEKQKNYKKKNKRKYTEDIKKQTGHHKKFEEQEKWVQCQLGKAFFVQGFKQILFYIQCPSQKHFEPTKQKKLRTAKMLLNKIIWSFSVEDQSLYKVGYMDKDMGLIETTIFELKTFQYNQNRIKYIKRHNQIVWDRQNKIDHFG